MSATLDMILAELQALRQEVGELRGDRRQSLPPREAPVDLPESSEEDRIHRLQREGQYILQTQGMAAYRRFWKEQAKGASRSRKRAA